jgi:hypothetical protein
MQHAALWFMQFQLINGMMARTEPPEAKWPGDIRLAHNA